MDIHSEVHGNRRDRQWGALSICYTAYVTIREIHGIVKTQSMLPLTTAAVGGGVSVVHFSFIYQYLLLCNRSVEAHTD